jgi:hypothetical protein
VSDTPYQDGYEAALRARGITEDELAYREGYHAATQGYLRVQDIPGPAAPLTPTGEAQAAIDAMINLLMNAPTSGDYADTFGDVAPTATRVSEAYEQGWRAAKADTQNNAPYNAELPAEVMATLIEALTGGNQYSPEPHAVEDDGFITFEIPIENPYAFWGVEAGNGADDFAHGIDDGFVDQDDLSFQGLRVLALQMAEEAAKWCAENHVLNQQRTTQRAEAYYHFLVTGTAAPLIR